MTSVSGKPLSIAFEEIAGAQGHLRPARPRGVAEEAAVAEAEALDEAAEAAAAGGAFGEDPAIVEDDRVRRRRPRSRRRGRRPGRRVDGDDVGESGPSTTRRVVLGVSGGIAAYKAVEVCRRLVDAGVHVAPGADRRRRPASSARPPSRPSPPSRCSAACWDEASPIPHTRLGQGADLVLVAPATADFLARYAAGLADDLLTATLLATRAPVLVCPAMHTEMWEHPAVRENLATLRRRGVVVVRTRGGPAGRGRRGAGRLADPAAIVARALELLEPGRPADLAGRRVVVSAGGTREPIDPVRFLTNRSSGKQGHAAGRGGGPPRGRR